MEKKKYCLFCKTECLERVMSKVRIGKYKSGHSHYKYVCKKCLDDYQFYLKREELMKKTVVTLIEDHLEHVKMEKGSLNSYADEYFLGNTLRRFFDRNNYRLIDLPFLKPEVLYRFAKDLENHYKSSHQRIACLESVLEFLVYSSAAGYANENWIKTLQLLLGKIDRSKNDAHSYLEILNDLNIKEQL